MVVALIIFVALALVLRFVVLFFIVATLVEQRWIRIVEDVLREGPDLLHPFKELFGATVLDGVTVHRVLTLERFAGLVEFLLFITLLGLLLLVLVRIVVKDLLVSQLCVDFDGLGVFPLLGN